MSGSSCSDPVRGMVLENVYIPAGGDVPDREVNPKFGQKLDFIGADDRAGPNGSTGRR